MQNARNPVGKSPLFLATPSDLGGDIAAVAVTCRGYDAAAADFRMEAGKVTSRKR